MWCSISNTKMAYEVLALAYWGQKCPFSQRHYDITKNFLLKTLHHEVLYQSINFMMTKIKHHKQNQRESIITNVKHWTTQWSNSKKKKKEVIQSI